MIFVCHRCPHRQRPCAGACLCLVDGVDIIDHAETRYCPAGRYHLGLGDWIARLAHPLHLREKWVLLTRRPCGCAARQQQTNARFRGLWLWLLEWRGLFE